MVSMGHLLSLSLAYLNHLLSVLPERFAADPQADICDLMPWIEKIQEMFRASDVEY